MLKRTQDVHAKEMQRCKVHTLQVNPFWGRQVLVRALCMLGPVSISRDKL